MLTDCLDISDPESGQTIICLYVSTSSTNASAQLTYNYGGRDFRLTNVGGNVAYGVLA